MGRYRLSILALTLGLVVGGRMVHGQQEIGFIEKFALAPDRRAALAELIPGTEGFYYFNVLHHQNEGELAQAQALVDQWKSKFGETPQVQQMLARQMLLNYAGNSQRTLDYLRDTLGLDFNHAPPSRDRAAALSSQLDSSRLATEKMLERALVQDPSLNQIETAGLRLVMDRPLSPEQLRAMLQRVDRADLPQIVERIAEELKLDDSRGFGVFPIHQQLTLPQLEQLFKLRPQLIEQENFVRAYTARLAPSEGTSLADKDELRNYLERLLTWSRKLPASQNSFKALVLGNLLRLDMSEGKYDQSLFLEYLALPRHAVYYDMERFRNQAVPLVELGYVMTPHVPLPPVGDDSMLVRRYLEQFFQKTDDVTPFAKLLNREYLDRVLAETKILYGIGDSAKWYAKLSPTEQKGLKERVELRFSPQNQQLFSTDDKVQLQVELKNIPQLIIKIYAVNTLNYYRNQPQPISTDIDLDGLVANVESKLEFSQPTQLRHTETIDLSDLSGRGVWVIDLLGGGQRSRAVIQKGKLVSIERLGDAGQVYQILDEAGNRLKTAHIELGSRTYSANADGFITLPYVEQTVTRNILLVDEGFASLEMIIHHAETYELQSGFLIDRQSLVAGNRAEVGIRVRLTCNGRPISIKLLEDPKLTIIATDVEGIATTQVVDKLSLDDGDEFIHAFLVPQRLASLTFQLSGRVYNQNRDEKQTVIASYSISCNAIQQTDQIADFFLRQNAKGYQLLVLGRSGEPISRLPVSVDVKVERFASRVNYGLATNEAGEIDLGPLENVTIISASAQGMQPGNFVLHRFHRNWPTVLHAGLDSKIELPLGKDSAPSDQFALVDIRRDVPHDLLTKKLSFNPGALEISGLPAGDYLLHDYEAGQHVRIVVADAKDNDLVLAGTHRVLQPNPRVPLVIRRAVIEGDNLVVELAGADDYTRVHLVADPMFSDVSPGSHVQLPYPPLIYQPRVPNPSMFVESLKLDEEYSYILERQGITKFPGNMLAQPSLLVRPWEVSVTENAQQEAAIGDPMPKAAAPAAPPGMMMPESEAQGKAARPDWKSFDFLATPAILSANFSVENGKVIIPIVEFKGFSNLTVIAIHPTSSDSREVVVPKSELFVRDLRLKNAFDSESHLAQTQRVEVIAAGEKRLLGDPRTRRVQTYSSIADVYRLYGTLLNNAEWEKFSFVSQWHQLSDEQRKSHYNEMACHELNFFLYHKDRKFFDAVVKPLIAQKLDKQLVDRWLLGDSLESYDELWRVQRLNTLERILLAQSIEARRTGTERWLNDYVAANPLDPQSRASRFEVALRGMGLDQSFEGRFDKDAVMDFGSMGGLGGAAGNTWAMPSDKTTELLGRLQDQKERGGVKRQLSEMRRESTRAAGDLAESSLGLKVERFGGIDRAAQAAMFTSLDKTREWAETQYFHVRLQSQTPQLIPSNAFWQEFLASLGNEQFLPNSIDLPTGTINEALCALAVLGLPLDAMTPEVGIEEDQLAITTKQVAIAFIESIERAGEGGANDQILVGQDVYLAQPNTTEDANRPVKGALLRGIPYRANVVVTNPTNSKQLVQVLNQIPAGSLPLSSGKVTRNTPVELAPYSTAQVQYVFYFPREGEFSHYGAQISSEGNHIAATESHTHRVLAEPESVDETTWSYIADWGSAEQVLEFLKKANLQKIDLARIAFRMQDKAFFEQVTSFLASNNVFHPSLWAYAVKHNEPTEIEQLLQNRADFLGRLGVALDSPLVQLDPQEQMSYEHLDYKPLVVARIHRLGPKLMILNSSMFNQYRHLFDVIAHQRQADHEQYMELCYYMLLQNRIAEAIAWFDKVDADKLDSNLQYDYFHAYLDFYLGEYEQAAQLANKYAEYPVLSWKDLFAQVGDQVRQRKALEAGQDMTTVTSLDGNSNRQQRMIIDGREAQQNAAAAETPTLDLSNQDGNLVIEHRNLSDVKINYYLMDIELLFSRNPFVSRSGDKVPVIEPNSSEQIKLDAAVGSRKLGLPAELNNRNLLVEVTANGISRSTVVTANSLAVTVVEPFGRVQVLTAKGRSPLEQAYVKVYARHQDGSIKFYKDGYTDLRGQFDYATLSTSDLDSVERFAILVLHPTQGAVVREAAPPTK